MPIPSRHVELALYADDTAVMATSRKPALLVSYLESYLSDLERWQNKWRIAINVLKSMAMLFTRRHIQNPRPVLLFGEPIVMVDTARYVGVTPDKLLTWSSHIDQVRKRASQWLGVLGSLLNRRSGISFKNGVLLYRQPIRPMMDYGCVAHTARTSVDIRRTRPLTALDWLGGSPRAPSASTLPHGLTQP
jgi:hypothetical protein